MLGKNVGETGFTEVGGPRQETAGTTGFQAIGQGLAAAGALTKQKKSDDAAAAQGALVYDFLGFNLDASLESAGFDQLSPDQVADVKNQTEGFQGHLQQVVEQRGASAFVQTEILRTLHARSAIAANPAQAKTIIEASGLADKLSQPLLDSVKEEADFARKTKQDAVDRGIQKAEELGIDIPKNIGSDLDAALFFFNTNPQFQAYQGSQQLKFQAEATANAQDADKLDRTLGINVAVNDIRTDLIKQAQAIKSGPGSTSEKAAQLQLLGETAKQGLLVAHPLATQDDIASFSTQIDGAVGVGVQFLTDQFTQDQLGLYGKQLAIIGAELTNRTKVVTTEVAETFGRAQAQADYLLTNGQIANSSFNAIKHLAEFENNFALGQATREFPGLVRAAKTASIALGAGSADYYDSIINNIPAGPARDRVQLQALGSSLAVQLAESGTNPDGSLEVSPTQAAIPRNVAEALEIQKQKGTNPAEHRKTISLLTTEIATNPVFGQLLSKPILEPLADDIGDEQQARTIEALSAITQDSQSLFKGNKQFNPQGAKQMASVLWDSVKTAATGLLVDRVSDPLGVGTDLSETGDELQRGLARGLLGRLAKLRDNPNQQNFFNVVGEFMVFDEKTLRSTGQVGFRVGKNADLLDDSGRQFIKNRIDAINRQHSTSLTEGFEALRRARNYTHIFDAYNELVIQGNFGNLLPADTLIGLDAGAEQ